MRLALLPALLLLACDPQGETAPPEAAAPASPSAAPAGLPPGHPPITTGGAGPGAAMQQAAAPEAPASEGTAAEAVAPVPRAAGEDGRSVAEVYAQKAELSGKSVAVSGRVVKFNPNIMGANWVHLQDGSGSAATGDQDLTAKISGTVAVGDVVTIRGTLATDKDFGAGYSYAVILEDGAVVP